MGFFRDRRRYEKPSPPYAVRPELHEIVGILEASHRYYNTWKEADLLTRIRLDLRTIEINGYRIVKEATDEAPHHG